MIRDNLTMLTDFYEITMANGFLEQGVGEKEAVFDMFFRNIPDGGGFAIMAGVAQLVDYLKNLKFTDNDIEYLRNKNLFSEKFLEYLRTFKFSCDVWALEEGTPMFPGEPIVTVKGPAIQAQFVETMVLVTINHQSLIATKSNRIARAAEGRTVAEFGSRRAQSYDAAILGARAAYIGGAHGTACTISEQLFGIQTYGTMAHSWVQMFNDEYSAFKAYAETYPDSCLVLVDTYNVLKSGVPNAIKVAKEVLEPMGKRLKGIRLDSGDIAYLSKKARKMLDQAGLKDCIIMASNSLDEYIIRDLMLQNAKIDAFGVGERLITAKSSPVFGGVYKLVAVEENGELAPRIKISENIEKVTTPGFKSLYRFYDKDTNAALADLVTLHGETIDENAPYTIFHPVYNWKKTKLTNFYVKPLLKKIFDKGVCIYEEKSLDEIRDYCLKEVSTLWEEVLRFENPHTYYVDLSKDLWNLKSQLLDKYTY
ncbi:nicotinate phosphoribosyltransferase [Inconstantimicrobium mannanitabidum]|uniref:Nicotinate phosphoribosyltransferase n=1 Tax=Inconstantimicrobium mannanitabidum TaxID=1604901 RepID=A0ACB5RGV6_9CLOT|nr:nicotinate phosphoribosyltransferase [Clostridium sp. TW13]GKX68312.1 nicotinate phosphoribosyltransferase [Clostridium sp. TW13]